MKERSKLSICERRVWKRIVREEVQYNLIVEWVELTQRCHCLIGSSVSPVSSPQSTDSFRAKKLTLGARLSADPERTATM